MNPEALERRFQRERKARKAAEQLLEEKSLELYTANKKLEQSIIERTEQLHSSEYRTSAIIKSALDAIVIFDFDGIIFEFNPAASKLFGYNAKEILGKQMAEHLMPKLARSNLYRVIGQGREKGHSEIHGKLIELTALTKQGKEFDVDYHEALMQQPSADFPSNVVLEEVESGYSYKDKVIKHAKVIVSQEIEQQEESNNSNNENEE